MGKNLLFLCLLGYSLSGCNKPSSRNFNEIGFIDHQNLRYIENEKLIRFQVGEIKKNLDEAEKLGIDSYLLFAKETMEAALNYNFQVDGIGTIGALAFPEDSEHRKIAKYLVPAFKEVIEYAKGKNIKIYIHSNQFIFPDEVLPIIKPAVWGTAICPGKPATWEIYRKKIEEFINLFPGIAGLQITGDETQVSVLECNCENCRNIGFIERINMLTTETANVCAKYGMEVQMRTWQRMGELGDPATMYDNVPGNVVFSLKNTDGDFHITNPFDTVFIGNRKPERQIVEFDAWREYEGHNYFPCYLGDIWSPRFKKLKDLGVKRIAVRVNWNSNKNPIFECQWGNVVNIYTFLQLAKDPDKNPDVILKEFVAENYPEKTRETAFEIYKQSTLFQESIFNFGGGYIAHHSRMLKDIEDIRSKLNDYQKSGKLLCREDFDSQRNVINSSFQIISQLLDKIKNDAPVMAVGLSKGAQVEKLIALGILDQMEYVFCQQNNLKPGEEFITKIKERSAQWQNIDIVGFKDMRGDLLPALINYSPN